MQCSERLQLEQNCSNASATLDAAVQKRRERIGVCTHEEYLRLSQELVTASHFLHQIRHDLDRHIPPTGSPVCFDRGGSVPNHP
jgi:hypothetical protein